MEKYDCFRLRPLLRFDGQVNTIQVSALLLLLLVTRILDHFSLVFSATRKRERIEYGLTHTTLSSTLRKKRNENEEEIEEEVEEWEENRKTTTTKIAKLCFKDNYDAKKSERVAQTLLCSALLCFVKEVDCD